MSEWEDWRPQIAPHVRGRYEKRTYDPETKLPNDQEFEAVCTWQDPKTGKVCGARRRGHCSSGNVRSHIQLFAAHHVHDRPDAFDTAPRIERPSSLRRRAGPDGDYE